MLGSRSEENQTPDGTDTLSPKAEDDDLGVIPFRKYLAFAQENDATGLGILWIEPILLDSSQHNRARYQYPSYWAWVNRR